MEAYTPRRGLGLIAVKIPEGLVTQLRDFNEKPRPAREARDNC